ncbi:MAG: indolepyruvate ferredoxin oxidoreductase family protein [Burkholderiaceae bacterium]
MNAPASLNRMEMTLLDRYTADEGWLYMTGMQALVRLPIQQRLRDAAQGINSGGYISGYRGSPVGRYDLELWAAEEHLKKHNILFRAGVNEDLAATAIWGAQYIGSFPGNKVDGVFGIWYGKGPGVDRSGDPLRHANLAGSATFGGALAIAGDDHGAKSSTVANYSDLNFVAAGIPVLYPANAQELLNLGLHGIAMSRFSGCWIGMKVVTDVVEGGGSVYVSPDSPEVILPAKPSEPEGGFNSRAIDMPLPQEERLYHHKHKAVLAYARANAINRITINPARAHVGVLAAGKAWQDLQQALLALGLDEAGCEKAGLRILKIGMVWPLDPDLVRKFADGLDAIVVVEEKRPLLEDQVRLALYGRAHPPKIYGKHANGQVFDIESGPRLFPNAGEISPGLVARVLGEVLIRDPNCYFDPQLINGLPAIAGFSENDTQGNETEQLVVPPPSEMKTIPIATPGKAAHNIVPIRAPTFCSGCPHARSTKVPDGSRALAGIGCHSTALIQDPTKTTTWSHMGGEGVMWLGQHAFTEEPHVFANLGDGTLFHSGFMAVRQAVAAHVPITYKLLFNGFVSMTGGQKVDGEMTVPSVLTQFAAEGVKKMAVVTDDPTRYEGVSLPPGVPVHHRDELHAVQLDFREYGDVSVIVYDQPCATERRRLRKRGKWADPEKRTFINSAVCEGCGDCGVASNCLSVEPLETELGRKRRINQSSCNKDYTCVEGFCPSFVTVKGGGLKKSGAKSSDGKPTIDESGFGELPDPVFSTPTESFSILVSGIGGTGVVTIGQTLAVAAHLEGLYSSNLDVTGLSQKYGSVLSHIKLAPQPSMLHATRIAKAEADTLVGCDLIVSAGDEAMERLSEKTRGVICTDMVPTSDFARDPNWTADTEDLIGRVTRQCGGEIRSFEALRLARVLLGDSIGANMFLLGAAWQQGGIPISLKAIDRAIELNGVAIEMNKRAFRWGRRAIVDPQAVERASTPATHEKSSRVVSLNRAKLDTLDDIVNHRQELLTAYANRSYAQRFTSRIEKISAVEAGIPGQKKQQLAKSVARYYAKLLAHKDEFEVARLYTSEEFKQELASTFDGDYKLSFNVAGGPFGKRDKATGQLRKVEVGPWLMTAFKWLARFRGIRGTLLDPFRHSDERRLARQLLVNYEQDLTVIETSLNADNYETALRLASWPDEVRGYGHVRKAHADAAARTREKLLGQMKQPVKKPSLQAA